MCNSIQNNEDNILDSEHFTRWVYCPRSVDESGALKNDFVYLRIIKGEPEEGISGQIFEKVGHDGVLECGRKFIRTTKNGTKELFLGYVKAKVGSIRNIAEEMENINADNANCKIDVLYTESEAIPFHAEIRLYINNILLTGAFLKGITPNAYFLYYQRKLKKLFEKDFVKI